jgi:hypothetical protein
MPIRLAALPPTRKHGYVNATSTAAANQLHHNATQKMGTPCGNSVGAMEPRVLGLAKRGQNCATNRCAHGPPREETLNLVAPLYSKQIQLLGAFHALCNHVNAQRQAHVDKALTDRLGNRAAGQVLHKLAVNFQAVYGHVFQARKAGVAHAKVIHGHFEAMRPQGSQGTKTGLSLRMATDSVTSTNTRRRYASVLDQLQHAVDEARLS